MTIQARQKLVSSSKYSIKCPNSMNAEYITFHNTANDASAENEINYMIGNNNQVSYHYAIDDKEVVQGIPVNRNAWHCGDGNGIGNRKSIGVEVCYSKSGGDRYYKAEALAIKFIAQLLHERGWGVDRVKQHNHWSGKNCPHRVRAESRWQQVLDSINEELSRLNNPLNTEPNGIGTLKVIENTVIRDKPVYLGALKGNVKSGEEYIVHDYQTGWFNIGGWVYSKYVHFNPHADTKITN
jgi:N-acetylmuramoyl-L-alanine amidase